MNTFTIDSDNNITAHAGPPADADESQSFTNPKELAKLTTDWPACRLAELWNSFAGVVPFTDLKPVKKFTSRKAAIARIWQAVQRLSPDGAPQAADTAPGKRKAKKPSTEAEPRGVARPRTKRAANVAREGSKKAEVLDIMRRPKGATLAELMKLTGWQAHTVRGFVSGTLTKRLGLKIESFRAEDKERTYRVR